MSIPRRLGTLALALALAACPAPDSGENTVSADAPSTPDAARPDIQALNAFYYYEDVEAAWDFYTNVLGFETVVDYGFAKILQVAPASYLTLVDAARGMHSASEPKSVTLAIVTRQVQGWYDYLVDQGVDMRSDLNMREGSAHDGFVAIDPEGYLLEFEWFNDHEENERLSPRLDRIEPIQGGRGSRPSELGVHATALWLCTTMISAPYRNSTKLFWPWICSSIRAGRRSTPHLQRALSAWWTPVVACTRQPRTRPSRSRSSPKTWMAGWIGYRRWASSSEPGRSAWSRTVSGLWSATTPTDTSWNGTPSSSATETSDCWS